MEPFTPIVVSGEFVLLERPSHSSEWRNLKLVRHARRPGEKNTWWFGWNGERQSNAIDAKKLAEHHPDVLQWVIDSLRGAEQ